MNSNSNNTQMEGRFNPVIPSPSTTEVVIRPKRRPNNQTPETRRSRQEARSRKLLIETGRQTTVSANMPRNEQSTLREVVDTERDRAARDYLHCLVRPDECAARIPDSFSGDTALVTSVSVVRCPVFFTGMGANSGRFSLMIQPTLGSLSSPADFKIAEVQAISEGGGNYRWPDDLTAPPNFYSSDNGKDIRLDQNYSSLTQPPYGCAYYQGNNLSVSDSLPFGTGLIAMGGYNLDIKYGTQSLASSTFNMPPGLYNVSINIQDPTTTPGATGISVTQFGGVSITKYFGTISADGTNANWTGTVLVPPVPVGNNPGTFGSGIMVGCDTNAPIAAAYISFVRTYDDIPGVPETSGLVSKYRPVAMSVLASYTGPSLLDGGNITSCYLPAGAAKSQFFTNLSSTGTGSLANWENLAAVKGAVTNPIVKGSYTWWSPSTLSDYDMKTPDEARSYDYPTICVSGQSLPGSGTVIDGSNYVRVIVTTVYEITTDSLLLPSRHQRGSQAEMDRVLNHLVGVPHSMENPDHVSFGQKILNGFKSVGSWIWKNRKPIGSAIGILGSLV